MTSPSAENQKVDLALVMPVYNEQDCIILVLHEWMNVLTRTCRTFRIIVVDDGSTDESPERLKTFASDSHLEILRKQNEGHGPAILTGYQKAIECAQWVFQIDSDGEMPADAFPSLWERREEFDFLFGARTGRKQSVSRGLISWMSREVVHVWAGDAVVDVNVPYRLMRAALLADILQRIPARTFAPNVSISGLATKRGCRIANIPVAYQARRTGQVSLAKWRLVRGAILSLLQTVRILSKR